MISEIESIASPLNTYLFSTVIEMLNSKEGSHIHFGYEIPTAFTLLATLPSIDTLWKDILKM